MTNTYYSSSRFVTEPVSFPQRELTSPATDPDDVKHRLKWIARFYLAVVARGAHLARSPFLLVYAFATLIGSLGCAIGIFRNEYSVLLACLYSTKWHANVNQKYPKTPTNAVK